MKRDKIIYYATTVLVSGMMLFSAFMYLTNPTIKDKFHLIGFPDYFRVELAVAKVIGGIVLLLPMLSYGIKYAAYVGFSIVFVSAFIAHLATGDSGGAIMPLLFLGVLGISYVFYRKLNKGQAGWLA